MVSRRKPRAYSLVELVIAIAVLTFGLAAIYGQFRDTRQPSQRRYHLAQGQFHAQRLLAESLAAPYERLAAWKPSPEFDAIEDETRFSARTSLDHLAGDAIEVTVEVGWGTGSEAAADEFPAGQLVTLKGLKVK